MERGSTERGAWERALQGGEREGDALSSRLCGLAAEVGLRWPGHVGALAEGLSESADAELSLLRLLDVPEEGVGVLSAAGGRSLRRFVGLAGQSALYGRWVARDPGLQVDREARLLAEDAEVRRLLEVRSEAEGAEAEAELLLAFKRALRVRRRLRSLAVIEGEALDGEAVEETSAWLSAAANEAIADAWAWAEASFGVRDQRVCVLAMGKLGGDELNFSSDVDLIFASEPRGEERGEALSRAVRLFGEIMEEPLEPGPVHRVDLRLRPFGTQGPLVHTVEQMVAYYERHGRTWERGALIRACPVAGALEVGWDLLERLRPFVFRRYLDESAIEEIAAMKRQVDAEQRRRRGGREGPFNVKLGAGGIREVEFFAQTFQLVWGGRHEQLQSRGTLETLRRLVEFGLVQEGALARLTDAWRFLRLVEHRLQMDEERQTQLLPAEGEGLERLARRMGFADAAAFVAGLAKHREEVRRHWDRLFAQAEDEVESGHAWVSAVVDGLSEETVAERVEQLRQVGFGQPSRALADLERLAAPPEALIGRFAPGPVRRAVEGLLGAVVETALPDRGLERCVSMLSRRDSRGVVLKVLQSKPRSAGVLASFFGSAGELGVLISREPVVLEEILSGGGRALGDLDGLRRAFARGLELQDLRHGRPSRERRLVWIRRMRAAEELEVALGEISGRIGVGEATAALSRLAEVCLESTLSEAVAELGSRLPPGAGARFGALALGKLGAGELGHGGDVDVVFVFSDDSSQSGAYARLAQRWISFLSIPMAWGRCYAVDMRLRPDGSQGAVVTTCEGLGKYYAERAWPWEKLALVRARPVACSPGLSGELARTVEEVLASMELDEVVADVSRLRTVRLGELHERGGTMEPKGMDGGLMDLEHVVHLLWLANRGVVERCDGHVGALLDGLASAGVIGGREASSLRRAHTLFRSVEMRLRLSEGADLTALPADEGRMDALARWVLERGDANGSALEEALEGAARGVRRSWAQHFGG